MNTMTDQEFYEFHRNWQIYIDFARTHSAAECHAAEIAFDLEPGQMKRDLAKEEQFLQEYTQNIKTLKA